MAEILTRNNDELGCSPYGRLKPSAMEIAKARKSFTNRARALLKMLGMDPTPANVSKIKASEIDPRVLMVNNREFLVMDNEETIQELTLRILTNPKRLPAKYLALFLTGALSRELPFEVVRIVAACLRNDETLESNYALHKMIDLDKFSNQHIQEIIDQVGIEVLFYSTYNAMGNMVNQVEFNGANYVIVEQIPNSEITRNYYNSEISSDYHNGEI